VDWSLRAPRAALTLTAALTAPLWAAPALAQEPALLATAGVTLQAPPGWHVDLKPDLIVMMDKAGDDATAMVTAAALQSTSLQGAVADLDKAIAAALHGAPPGPPPEEVTLGDMQALWVQRAGHAQGRSVTLRGAVVATPSAKVLMVLALYDAASGEDADATARAILESVRAAKP
jgi:hypothetical protein